MASRGWRLFWCCGVLLAVVGCTRTSYRLRADRDAYAILHEKAAHLPWPLPAGFHVEPDPRSRFYDPSPVDDPLLPVPAPRLYDYVLPPLPRRDPARFRGDGSSGQEHPAHSGADAPAGAIRAVSFQEEGAGVEISDQAPANRRELPAGDAPEGDEQLPIAPVPEQVWQSLPRGCLIRMFEFRSIREEYQRTFGEMPGADRRDPAPRLALEDIVQQALINSREYQTEKEKLYKAALALSLERFDYDMKFATGEGRNRSRVRHTHARDGGVTEDTLSVPTTLTENALLATGGTLLASFANRVVLTFNGPEGFAADIGSELLLDLSHSVFQRDIVFEDLTQAEREVVYAARRFLRFRKQLFVDLAGRYYRLLLAFRGIEINAQDYFSNLRGFLQGQAEYRAGRLPRFQVDQFEQRSLESRSRLIDRSNALEQDLDELKRSIGLPVELPVNLDLTELEELTLRDETTASAERVRRERRNLIAERRQPKPQRDVLVKEAVDLVGRMLDLAERRADRLREDADVGSLELLRSQLRVAEAELAVRRNRQVLSRESQAAQPAPPLRIFRRTVYLADSLFVLIARQTELAERLGVPADQCDAVRAFLSDLRKQHAELLDDLERTVAELRADLEQSIDERPLDRIAQLVQMAKALLGEADALAARAAALVPRPPADKDQELQQTLQQVDRLIADSQAMLQAGAGGLAPVEIAMDDAMLTALTLRFDLDNERGALADAWRQIKLAGDDLKSILNLHATETIRTRSDTNRPFDFTFDDHQTQLTMTFDAPLNRFQQRNTFRETLIDYNAALRNLIDLEDGIKLAVRNDLRALEVDREQYRIAVASAALAYERIISTRMQLRLGIQNITARDVLEAQQAYTSSLNAMAQAHIDFILDRIQLFHDLELLQVDQGGFWPWLYDERHQPVPNLVLPDTGCPVYGQLPHRAWHSHKIRRMLHVPPGETMIFRPDAVRPPTTETIPAPEPQRPSGP